MNKWNETAAKADDSLLETQASQTQYVNACSKINASANIA